MSVKNDLSYSELNKELEAIISELQSTNQDLDKIIIKYERAQYIIKQLFEYLKTTELKIKKINS